VEAEAHSRPHLKGHIDQNANISEVKDLPKLLSVVFLQFWKPEDGEQNFSVVPAAKMPL
jgi:hypothetical protein